MAVPLKAAILVDALAHASMMDDWGSLTASADRNDLAAQLLIELKGEALPFIVPLLGDTSPAFLSGSERSTTNIVHGVRKCDYAFRYACIVSGREPVFDKDPIVRDELIQRFRQEKGLR